MEPRPVAPLFGNWPYDPTTASLTLRSGHHPEASITSEVVKMWLKTAQQGGFARVRTNAVSPQLAGILATVGFSVKQELSLLTAPLENVPSDARTVSARRITAAQAIRIDCAAFHGEWAIDPPALLAAKQATQFHRDMLDQQMVLNLTSGSGIGRTEWWPSTSTVHGVVFRVWALRAGSALSVLNS